MNYTTNFNLNKPEGTDLYNHLTVDNPNMDTIDAAMQANKLASVGAATELVSGTVHAITRADSDQNIFKFKATGDFKAGDTITVDGVSVNAYNTAGQQLVDDVYVLSSEVLCILDGTSLWVLANKIQDAADTPYDNNTSVKDKIDSVALIGASRSVQMNIADHDISFTNTRTTLVSSNAINIAAGNYVMIGAINATWTFGSYQVSFGIEINNNYAPGVSLSAVQTNTPCVFMSEVTIPVDGQYIINVAGMSQNANKMITVPGFQSTKVFVIKKPN